MENTDTLTFENEQLTFGDVKLSFEDDKLSFENDEVTDFEDIEDTVVEQEKQQDRKWLTAEEAENVVKWLKQVISYNLRNDITSFAKQTLTAVNTCAISYEQLNKDLEKIKNTFNAVAKRRGR